MKTNYIQVRFQSNKSDKCLSQILHNTRKIEPNYLRNNYKHNKENNTIYIFNNNDFIYLKRLK